MKPDCPTQFPACLQVFPAFPAEMLLTLWLPDGKCASQVDMFMTGLLSSTVG